MCLLPLLWKSTQHWPSCNLQFFLDLYVVPWLRNFALKQRLCIVLSMFISEPNLSSLKPLWAGGFLCFPLGWRDWGSLKRSFGQEWRVHLGSALNDMRGPCVELWTSWELTRQKLLKTRGGGKDRVPGEECWNCSPVRINGRRWKSKKTEWEVRRLC